MLDAVFINPMPGGVGLNEASIEPPLGLAYLASMLKKHGMKCSIVDANLYGIKSSEVVNQIPPETRFVGIYLNSFCLDSSIQLATLIRDRFSDMVIAMGGPLPTVMPEMVLEKTKCNGVIKGEGEFAILRIMENIKKGKLPFDSEVENAVYYHNTTGELIFNPSRRIIDLDSLPFPAYDLLPPMKKYKSRSKKRPVAAIVTSRGCAFDCTFCSKDIFKRKVTYRSAENVLEEIDYLVKEFNVKQIDILDDNFSQNIKRVNAILDGIIARNYDIAINLQSGIRTEMLDEAVLVKMKKAGFYKVAFGIESADPVVLEFCRKKLNLGKVAETVKIAKKLGFLVYGFFIIGLPGETEEGFRKTMDFAKEMDFDIANFCIAVPFAGTDLFRLVEKNGKFLVDTTGNISTGFYGGEVFYEYGDLKKEDVKRRFIASYKEYYSFWRKVKILLNIRSLAELLWFYDAGMSVLKGSMRRLASQNIAESKKQECQL